MQKLLLERPPEPNLDQPMTVYYQHLARQVGGVYVCVWCGFRIT
jgi:hypothetical protein